MRIIKISILSFAMASVIGCTSTSYEQEIALSQGSFNNQIINMARLNSVAEHDETQWWQQLGDVALDDLVKEVLLENQELKASAARLRAAAAGLSDAQRARLPQGNLNVSAQRSKSPSLLSAQGNIQESVTAGGELSWQVDLSGRISKLANAAAAAAESSQGQYQELAGELVTTTIQSYLNWQALQQMHQLTVEQLIALEESIKIIEVRVAEGVATELELNRTKSQYFEHKQRLPEIATELALVEQTIAMLVNKQVGALQLTALNKQQFQQLTISVSVQSASDALMKRGDVKSAMARLKQQSYLSQSAERALYPDISFSAFAGVLNPTSANFNDTQSNWQVTPSLNWSLFSYPQLLAQLDRQEAIAQANYYEYRQTLIRVLAKTEYSLRALTQTKLQLNYVDAQVDTANKAYGQAMAGYQEGQLGYLELLDARQDVLIAQQSQMAIRNRLLSASVDVYGELNGQWSQALIASI
ncbi:TolC family protein [Pseudoalteromonas luteoviolacea]|uniref:TolC family protein n=1 Tax=Pseudoalteromonas luteoviolacea TaxID=43657 RepID=UPI0011523263|nr:TolC family protein [Pseudoalteromonas luteoviolacea]TQF67603.1 TolC family protein [Pseudoalteromonas luteoviolacea]